MSDFLSKLNPFYKFVLVIVVSTALAFTRSMWLNIGVFGACMFLLIVGARPKQWLRTIKFLIPVTFFAFSIFMTGARFGGDATGGFGVASVARLAGTHAGLNMATRFFAFAGLGLLFSLTTNPYDLVKAMQKNAKLPRKFAYGMLCAINLMPYIKNEYDNAKLAFQVRGVKISVFSIKPVFSMLVNCFRWSEVMSIAMFSKGFHEER
ncbi:MAG: energy-coupling factor transporter transmembrane protein EcfT [Treponema sp.]|nr:energy-coupling factor transporter transmembrane protein EcfT [Treponema sp.]